MEQGVINRTLPQTLEPTGILSCEVHHSFEELAALREEWDRFVCQTGGDIYFSYDWCRVWWNHYGSDRELNIFSFRIDGELAGLVPLYIDRFGPQPVGLRIAKLVGSEYTAAICDPPMLPAHVDEILGRLFRYIFGILQCDAVWFGPLAGTYEHRGALYAACKRLHDSVRITRDIILSPHTVFDLPNTFDSYLGSLERRQRNNYHRDLALLRKQFRMRTDILTHPSQIEGEFARFKHMHDEQWRAEGKLGHFGDWPGSETFNLEMARSQAIRGRLRLIRLVVNDEVVAYQLCYKFEDCYYWRLPARRVGPTWARYGLGRIGMMTMIEAAISEGARRIEAGPGHYDYKVKSGGTEYPLRSIVITANRLSSRVRTHAFCTVADLLHFFYYRIWFRHVVPTLPLKRRPLWNIWIRSRL